MVIKRTRSVSVNSRKTTKTKTRCVSVNSRKRTKTRVSVNILVEPLTVFNILDLPVELIDNILRFVDKKTLFNLITGTNRKLAQRAIIVYYDTLIANAKIPRTKTCQCCISAYSEEHRTVVNNTIVSLVCSVRDKILQKGIQSEWLYQKKGCCPHFAKWFRVSSVDHLKDEEKLLRCLAKFDEYVINHYTRFNSVRYETSKEYSYFIHEFPNGKFVCDYLPPMSVTGVKKFNLYELLEFNVIKSIFTIIDVPQQLHILTANNTVERGIHYVHNSKLDSSSSTIQETFTRNIPLKSKCSPLTSNQVTSLGIFICKPVTIDYLIEKLSMARNFLSLDTLMFQYQELDERYITLRSKNKTQVTCPDILDLSRVRILSVGLPCYMMHLFFTINSNSVNWAGQFRYSSTSLKFLDLEKSNIYKLAMSAFASVPNLELLRLGSVQYASSAALRGLDKLRCLHYNLDMWCIIGQQRKIQDAAAILILSHLSILESLEVLVIKNYYRSRTRKQIFLKYK